jgi:DNA-binding CsgD family transcriptional regulator
MAGSRVGLVGRDGVLARLSAHLAGAAAGDCRFVLLCGEPGIGKSRLAAAVVEIAEGRGFSTMWGGCRETEGAPPFWPWTQVFRAALAGHADLDTAPAPLLNPQPGGETDRFRLFDAAVRTLADLARTSPVLVVLDDLHRADEASLALLRFLVLTLREVPVLVLGTYRDTDVAAPHPLVALVADLAADATFDLIGLDRLSRADTLAFLRQRAPLTDAGRADALYRRTGGNPFFLTEVVKLGVTDDSAVPASVEAAIEARVSRLPEGTRTLLGLAAVLGRDADADLLAETAGLARRDVLAALTPAVKQGLIGPNPQNPAEYRFVHVLVQQTLYAGLPPDQQLELHDQLATRLAHRVDAEPGLADAAAHHAARAAGVPGGRDRAFAAAFRAAGLAAERLADETAAQWYTRALELAPPHPGLEVTLLLELGRVAGRSGQADVARSAYDQAWVAAVRADDRARAADAALGLGQLVVSSGTIDAGVVARLEASLHLLRPGDAILRVRLTARLAIELYWGQLARARPLAAQAVTDARVLGDRTTLAAALAAQQFVLRGPDRLAERISLGEELITLAYDLDDELLEMYTRRLLCSDRLRVDLTTADAEVDALDELAQRIRRPIAAWYTLLLRTLRTTMSGRLDDAAVLVDQAEALGRRIGAQPARLYATIQRCFLGRHLGRIAEHEQPLRREITRQPAMVSLRALLALLLADTGRPAEALALLDDLVAHRCAVIPRDAVWLAGVSLLAETAAVLDHPEHAATLDTVLAPHRGEVCEFGVGGWVGAIDLALARTATVLRHWDDAEIAFHSALRIHEAWGAVPLVAATLTSHAAMLRRRGGPGDRARAARLSSEAAHLSRPAPTPTAPGPLTARESDILRLLARGASNKEMARNLSLSVHTVERHVANLYQKIGVRNRAEATAYHLRAKDR